MSTIRQSTIQSSKFHGHQGSVLCLDITDDGERAPFLLSGSEDKTARLWDLRDHRRRASLCIQAEGEVLSAAFAPSTITRQHVTTPPTALEGAFALDFTVYLSVENGVYGYDLRKASVPIIKCPSTILCPILQNQDEVNQIQLAWYMHSQHQQQHQPHKNNNKRKGGSKHKTTSQTNVNATSSSSPASTIPSSASMYLAAADDAGKVRFMDTNTITLDESLSSTSSTSSSSVPLPTSQILHHDPNGVAVVPTCAFRPGGYSNRSLELASGGTDCKIHLWDILKPRKPIASYTIRPVIEEAEKETSKPQVCNPPMVYTLAWSPSGRILASGLGDGNCYIFSVEQRSLVQVGLLTSGHDDSVASIVFPSFATAESSPLSPSHSNDKLLPSRNNTVEVMLSQGNERVVLSAGNDGAIFCWDLGSLVGGAGGEWDPSMLFASSLLEQKKKDNISNSLDDLSLLVGDKPKILFGIPHGSKPNWMVSRQHPATVFVADTSNDITAYTIPLAL